MARIGKNLTNHAGSKALALLAAAALWILIPIEESQEHPESSGVEVRVAVEPAWSGVELGDFVIEEFTVDPPSLRIAGPATRVRLLERLATEPIDVAAIAANGALEAAVALPDPQLRFVDNPIVRVEVKVRRR